MQASRLSMQDMDTLQAIHQFTYLDMVYLQHVVYPEKSQAAILKILWKLQKLGYIERTPKGALHDFVYVNTKKTNRIMQSRYNISYGLPCVDLTKRQPRLLHQVELSHVVADMLTQTRALLFSEKEAFFQYGPSQRDVIRPDALLLERKESSTLYFIELERALTGKKGNELKMRRYQEYLAREAYLQHVPVHKDIHCVVLFVAPRVVDVQRISRHIRSVHFDGTVAFQTMAAINKKMKERGWI